MKNIVLILAAFGLLALYQNCSAINVAPVCEDGPQFGSVVCNGTGLFFTNGVGDSLGQVTVESANVVTIKNEANGRTSRVRVEEDPMGKIVVTIDDGFHPWMCMDHLAAPDAVVSYPLLDTSAVNCGSPVTWYSSDGQEGFGIKENQIVTERYGDDCNHYATRPKYMRNPVWVNLKRIALATSSQYSHYEFVCIENKSTNGDPDLDYYRYYFRDDGTLDIEIESDLLSRYQVPGSLDAIYPGENLAIFLLPGNKPSNIEKVNENYANQPLYPVIQPE